jgi:hypothetical protein
MDAEQPIDAPPARPGRSLTGFYIAIGVVAALVGLGAWLWTPAQVWYWERQVSKDPYHTEANGLRVCRNDREMAACKLADLGPIAGPAFRRLLQSNDMDVRVNALIGVCNPRSTWALPLVADCARDESNLPIIWTVVRTAEEITGQTFRTGGRSQSELLEARRKLMAWWEREGQAKYGEPPK